MTIKKWYSRYFLMFIFLFISLFIIKHIFIYFTPFIIAAVLSSLINPVVDYLSKLMPINRGFIVVLVLILVIILLISVLIVGGAQIYLELNRLLRNLPDYKSIGSRFQWIVNQNEQFDVFLENLDISEPVKDAINSNFQMIYDGIRNTIISFVNNILDFLSRLPNMIMILFISFIATFFISKDRDKIKTFLVRLFPQDVQPKIANVFSQLNISAIGYIRAMLILISITGIITGFGLTLLGNQYAIIFAVAAAILDLIPIIGPAMLFYPWIIISLFMQDISFAFSLVILHAFIAGIRSASEGKIMGKNLGLHPLATMTAIYSGFRILGGIGVVVGPSFLVLVKAIIDSELIDIKE
ncbi:MAG: sporulation integral membrane protein YtvI [Bacillota bacterium]